MPAAMAAGILFSSTFTGILSPSSFSPPVARLFDRAVPLANQYWRTRQQYIPPSPGYYFMPLFYDLLLRSGVPSETLFSEQHLQTVECILDSVARFEFREISEHDHQKNCRARLIELDLTVERVDDIERELVLQPFELIPPSYTALTRANTFLYATALVSTNHTLIRHIWESFMPLILFLDDVEDVEVDQAKGEENTLLQGLNPEETFFTLHPIFRTLLARVQPLNPALFAHLEGLRQSAFQKGFHHLIRR